MIKTKTAPTTCETTLQEAGLHPIAGVDEAGRGSLAGPVIACALILPPGHTIEGVNDSKTLSSNQRIKLANKIKSTAIAYSFGIIDAATIDKINIHNATLKAMTIAIESLQIQPKVVLVDGKFAPRVPFPTINMIKGDSLCHSIAAASILAKEFRDDIMLKLHNVYPLYGFNRHKGYGTMAHKEAIKHHGTCAEHRTSYKIT